MESGKDIFPQLCETILFKWKEVTTVVEGGMKFYGTFNAIKIHQIENEQRKGLKKEKENKGKVEILKKKQTK